MYRSCKSSKGTWGHRVQAQVQQSETGGQSQRLVPWHTWIPSAPCSSGPCCSVSTHDLGQHNLLDRTCLLRTKDCLEMFLSQLFCFVPIPISMPPCITPSPWEMKIYGKITSFFPSSTIATMVGRGSKSQKPSTALEGWKDLTPKRRNHESNSLAAAAALPQDFHMPSTMKIHTEELQNWKAEQAHLASGTHQSTEIWSMQFLHNQVMYVFICSQLSRKALDRAWQKPLHSCPSSGKDWFHRTVQTCRFQIFFPALY